MKDEGSLETRLFTWCVCVLWSLLVSWTEVCTFTDCTCSWNGWCYVSFSSLVSTLLPGMTPPASNLAISSGYFPRGDIQCQKWSTRKEGLCNTLCWTCRQLVSVGLCNVPKQSRTNFEAGQQMKNSEFSCPVRLSCIARPRDGRSPLIDTWCRIAASRSITVEFNADVEDGMPWRFRPTQRAVQIKPGESALAFYTAHNTRSDAPVRH